MKQLLFCLLVLFCMSCSTAKKLMKNCEYKFAIEDVKVYECVDPND